MSNKVIWDFIEFWKDDGCLVVHTLHSKQWFEIYKSITDFSKASAITLNELKEIYNLAEMYSNNNLFLDDNE